MPEPVESTGAKGAKYLSSVSRYAESFIIRYGQEKKLAFATYRTRKLQISPSDKHYEITKEMEYRPDKVSYQFYKAPDFWWKIMELNKMKDVLEFKAGRNIVLPDSVLLF